MVLKLAYILALGTWHAAYAQTTNQNVNASLNARCIYNSKAGECVHSYQCDPETNTIIEDGAGIFNNRIGSNEEVICPLPLICCGLPLTTSIDETDNGVKPQKVKGCGWRNPNGVNFTDRVTKNKGRPGEFPWLVNILSLRDQNPENLSTEYKGDGALLHPRAVLTAAHTVENIDRTLLRVIAGVYDIRASTLPKFMMLVDDVVIHPDYDSGTLVNDVAIVFLTADVQFQEHIAPICLPPPDAVVAVGTTCISAGWGKDIRSEFQYVLSMVELPILENSECQSILRVATRVGRYFQLNESFMCAGGEISVDTCRGGGGAPLICPVKSQPNRYVAAGVTSWDMACGDSGVPAVYVRTPRMRSWIDSAMQAKRLSTDTYTL